MWRFNKPVKLAASLGVGLVFLVALVSVSKILASTDFQNPDRFNSSRNAPPLAWVASTAVKAFSSTASPNGSPKFLAQTTCVRFEDPLRPLSHPWRCFSRVWRPVLEPRPLASELSLVAFPRSNRSTNHGGKTWH